MIKRLIEDLETIRTVAYEEDDVGFLYNTFMPFIETTKCKQELNNIKDFLTRLEQVDLKETIKFVKNFIPLDEPNCSACMYYTESDCTQEVKGKCRLYELQNLLNILKGEE